MGTKNRSMRAIALCLVVGPLLAPERLLAQEMDHSKMHLPESSQPSSASSSSEEKSVSAPASTHLHASGGAQTPAEPIDHSKMGHDMAAMEHRDASAAPSQPRTPIPIVTDADRAAAAAPSDGHPAHDNNIQRYLLLDRLEGWSADPGAGAVWEMQGWLGTDLDRLWLRSERERVDGRTESADLELLYGHSIARWWEVLVGVRHDFGPGGSQDFAAIGVMGLAPYLFEVQATAYIGQSGQTAARVEVEYEMLLTNRLILQPLIEANFHGRTDPRRGIGSGLSTAEAGLRLRYEITRQFAPYVGIVHERSFGRTADLHRAEGEDPSETRMVAGFRIWF